MTVYDHAYMAWHSLKLNWYLVSWPKYGLTVSNLDYDQTAIFQHSDTKSVNRACGRMPDHQQRGIEIVNIRSIQAYGLHGHCLRT